MEPTGQQKKKQSPWLYIGIGCGVLLLLGVGGFIASLFFIVKKGQEYTADLSNPIKRTEMVKKTLGAKTLPDGYHAVMSLSVPLVMDMALLSTRSPDDPQKLQGRGERIFMYFFIKAASTKDQEELRSYLEGKSEDSSVLVRNNVKMGEGEIIGRGVIELEGRRVLYLTQRGELQTEHSKKNLSGLNSISFLECSGEQKLRMAMWIAPDPAPEAPLEELDLKGTPVDPEALRAFMTHLNPCEES